MITRNISLSDELDNFIIAEVETGRYENASEVVRTALRTLQREEKRYETKLAALRSALDEGEVSSLAEDHVFSRIRQEREQQE